MHEIDLGSSAIFKVTVDGKAYELREPLTGELKSLSSDMEKAGDENSDQVFIKFVVMLGLPEAVAKSLGAIRLKKLSEGIMGGLQGGK